MAKIHWREAQPDDPIYKLGWLGFSARWDPRFQKSKAVTPDATDGPSTEASGSGNAPASDKEST